MVSIVGLGFELAVVPPLAGEGRSLREGVLKSVPEAGSSQRRSGGKTAIVSLEGAEARLCRLPSLTGAAPVPQSGDN